MKFLQILSIILGLIGMCFAFYRYYLRPSVLAIPVIVTASALILILGQTLPFIWLVAFGKLGLATVTGIDCESGQKHHVRYQFSVGPTLITDQGPDGYGNTSCTSIRVGDSGLVTYVPADPTIHVWGRAVEYLFVLLLALVLAPIISYLGVRKRIREQDD